MTYNIFGEDTRDIIARAMFENSYEKIDLDLEWDTMRESSRNDWRQRADAFLPELEKVMQIMAPSVAADSMYQHAGNAAVREVLAARTKHAPMRGAHEGYAVLLEEVDELWAEVKARKFDKIKGRAEAKQIAAMAIAFMVEVCSS